MEFIQQATGCSDLDVVLSGQDTPSFRMILPESIFTDDGITFRHVHIIPGAWETTPTGLYGTFYASKDVQVSVEVNRGCVCFVTLAITNRSPSPLSNLFANLCLAFNRVPGKPAWCSQAVLPGQPLERNAQGRYWYEHATPRNARALADHGWLRAHVCPDAPDADAVEPFHMQPYDDTHVSAYAVAAPGETQFLFHTWDVPCRHVAPYPGAPALVLVAALAEELAPGESAEIHGVMGVFEGNWDTLAAALREGRFAQHADDHG